MLTVVILLPGAVAALLVVAPRLPDRAAGWTWVATAAVDLALIGWLWWRFDPPSTGVAGAGPAGVAYEVNVRWIPTVDAGYHVGVDGLSLPLLALTGVLFLACAVWSLREPERPRSYAALFLFLQTASLGTFAALDLILFFVFFDLTIVGMYFVIAGWGHGNRRRSALKFFLYTFLGSLALLVGFIGLYVGGQNRTFDMVALAADPPLRDTPVGGGLVLLAVGLGLAIKTPLFPFHTWLPDAHTDAPAAGSAILAGILLKLGTYGFVRIAMPMLPDAWRRWALVIVVFGVLSVLWGAFVALAQTDVKRMVAYTSVNHMGYILLGLGAAGVVDQSDPQARTVAVAGALVQMVSHGLLTGALFLLTGVLWARGRSYAFTSWGGLARPAPVFAGVLAVAAFGSLGLPGFSSFIAEFQIFAGALPAAPVATVIAVTGILVTAGLFLLALQRLLTGPTRLADPGGQVDDPDGMDDDLAGEEPAMGRAPTAHHDHPDGTEVTDHRMTGAGGDIAPPGHGGSHDGHDRSHRAGPERCADDTHDDAVVAVAHPAAAQPEPRGAPPSFTDLRGRELGAVVPLLALSVLIGLVPRPLLAVIEPAAAAVVTLVAR